MTELQFKQFLNKHNALGAWQYNLKQYGSFREKVFFQTEYPEAWIGRAFAWSSTKECHNYWLKLHLKWLSSFSKHNLYT